MNHEYLLRSHKWEKEDVPDRIRICHHHRKPVNPDSDTSCRRHTVFNGAQKVFINCHGFMISLCSEPCLFLDRKSTRLNSSHVAISYAVFCLKKKNKLD